MDTLKKFYKQTKPWGFWDPVKEAVIKEDPEFVPNKDFKRDSFNVLIGIVWQMSMVLLPIYLLTGQYTETIVAAVILLLTSVVLKKTWYNNLKNIE